MACYEYPYFTASQCSSLSTLFLLTRDDTGELTEPRWQCSVIDRCLRYPQETGYKDSCGDTPLHRVCQRSNVSNVYKVDAVKTLLQVNKGLAIVQNSWGETPLHCVLNTSNDYAAAAAGNSSRGNRIAEEKILRLILQAQLSLDRTALLKKTYLGRTALHEACCRSDPNNGSPNNNTSTAGNHVSDTQQHERLVQILVQAHVRAGLSVNGAQNDLGDTPLICALKYRRASSQLVSLLVEYDCGSVHTRNKAGWDAIRVLFSMAEEICAAQQQSLSSNAVVMSSRDEYHDLKEQSSCSAEELEMVEMCNLLFHARSFGHIADASTTIHPELLHLAVTLDCPPRLLRVLIASYPDQLVLGRKCDGKTPLAIAASTPGLVHGCNVIAVMVDACTEAAGIPDRDGHLPLQLALMNYHNRKDVDAWRLIMNAEIRAVSTRDKVTKLYPFVTAALSTCRDEAIQVESIWELLMAAPECLQRICHLP
eukprot:CAMPEP_0116017418 /NCGR_PEP_ID=MMETSP0321-20121206/8036_1 /TAXON_ID=163516 /ORGANISM="Leptocylindrus danicus var. danicus, Strain B650" /LENGTH=479 /DNA_ID=CAMNT_0003487607 /DNA_START=184 /DNA_END=1623 /DNA_ORIENTATION=+